ncbi:hypothetical protein ACOSQ4_006825 [Xanthoceras sorbifolium]
MPQLTSLKLVQTEEAVRIIIEAEEVEAEVILVAEQELYASCVVSLVLAICYHIFDQGFQGNRLAPMNPTISSGGFQGKMRPNSIPVGYQGNHQQHNENF